jgi:hypothetical protein
MELPRSTYYGQVGKGIGRPPPLLSPPARTGVMTNPEKTTQEKRATVARLRPRDDAPQP